ncbi:MAG: hypothetical protein DMF61_07260 [Blastocatellia bacterium AA13]|nr:MAG: hypothetical protein DMF61_07260 [Blastocatellia bacterium AA13]
MKRCIFLSLSILILTVIPYHALGSEPCEFNIIGTWRVVGDDNKVPTYVSFASDGAVAVRGSAGVERRVIAEGSYKLDAPKSPKKIAFAITKTGAFLRATEQSMTINVINDASFESAGIGAGTLRWTRVELIRHFLVFAGREGNSLIGGPAFAMLIKKDGGQTTVEAEGLYFVQEHRQFGAIPKPLYEEFMKERNSKTDVMLRIEITQSEFDRSLAILRDWRRRAEERTLPYPPAQPRGLYVDTSVLLKQIAENLNQCVQRIKLYDLNWRSDDEVAVNYNARQVPFQYLKRLRELNEERHVRDQEFMAQTVSLDPAGR